MKTLFQYMIVFIIILLIPNVDAARAQETARSQIHTLASEAAAALEPPPGYGPYAVNTVQVVGRWGWVAVHSDPLADSSGGPTVFAGAMPIVKFGLARYDDASGWALFLENEQPYAALLTLNTLPDSMRWLQQIYIPPSPPDTKTTPVINLPNLPYAPGAAWRYIFGPASDHFPMQALDFGVLPRNHPGNVQAMDHGTVVFRGDTCLIIQHDLVRAMYQHILLDESSDLNVGKSVAPGQLLGKTTQTPGCGGSTSTDHVHVHFVDPTDNSIVPVIGNATLNGWHVVGSLGATQLTKGGISVDVAGNPALIPHATMTCEEATQTQNPPPVILYGGQSCQSITLAAPIPSGQTFLEQSISGPVHGIFVPYGHRAILTYVSNAVTYQACFDASVDQLDQFYYADSAIPIGGDTVSRVHFRQIGNFNDGCAAPYPATEPTCTGTLCGTTMFPPDHNPIYLPLVQR